LLASRAAVTLSRRPSLIHEVSIVTGLTIASCVLSHNSFCWCIFKHVMFYRTEFLNCFRYIYLRLITFALIRGYVISCD
jgi:hypothetical protein